jgi:hypothetical protein
MCYPVGENEGTELTCLNRTGYTSGGVIQGLHLSHTEPSLGGQDPAQPGPPRSPQAHSSLTTGVLSPNHTIVARQDLHMFMRDKYSLDLYLLALQRFQQADQRDRLSWFQIGGIYGRQAYSS